MSQPSLPDGGEIRQRMSAHIAQLVSGATRRTSLPADFHTASPAPHVTFRQDDDPWVSAVLVTYGTDRVVLDCLRSLAASIPNELGLEVIVVDNAHPHSPLGTLHLLTLATAGVRVLHTGANLGFGGGCEFGVRHAGGRFVALLNPDLLFAPGWLEPLIASLADPTVAIAAPVLLDPDGSLQEAGGLLFSNGYTRPDLRPLAPGEYRDVPYTSAACWLVRRQEHIDRGGFDPAFHPAYYEDVDLALRTRAGGGRVVVVGDSRVVHHLHAGVPDGDPPDLTNQARALFERWPTIPDDYAPMPDESA